MSRLGRYARACVQVELTGHQLEQLRRRRDHLDKRIRENGASAGALHYDKVELAALRAVVSAFENGAISGVGTDRCGLGLCSSCKVPLMVDSPLTLLCDCGTRTVATCSSIDAEQEGRPG